MNKEESEVFGFQIINGCVIFKQPVNRYCDPSLGATVEFSLNANDLKARIINREMRGEDASLSRQALKELQAQSG